MPYLPIGEDVTSEARRFITALTYTHMEMGALYNGLRGWYAQNAKTS